MERGRMRSARGRLTWPLTGAESSENSFFVSSIFEDCIQALWGYGGKSGYPKMFPQFLRLRSPKIYHRI